ARTFFDAMGPIHEGLPVLPLPPTTDRYENGGDEFQVPNVVGMTSKRATETLEKAGYQVQERSVNSQRKRGLVVSQTPRGFALPGETVTISVSTGYVPPPSPERPPPLPPPKPGPPPDRPVERPDVPGLPPDVFPP